MRLLSGKGRLMITFFAAWLSIVADSAAIALLLAWSGTFELGTALKAIVGWHYLLELERGLLLRSLPAIYLNAIHRL
jgi:cobalt/nickel transport system permease protein